MSEQEFAISDIESQESADECEVLVDVERIPDELIAEIRINPNAQALIHPDLKGLCSADYLRSKCYMTVPPGIGSMKISTPDIWGRSLPCGTGPIPFSTFVGGIVTAKGCFQTGHAYQQYVIRKDNPIGFFSKNSSTQETKVSNALLAEHFRSILVLGDILLYPDKTLDWLTSKWHEQKNILKVINRGIEIVSEDSDMLAINFRVVGVRERIWNGLDDLDPKNTLERRAEYKRRNSSDAARLQLIESQIFTNAYTDFLRNRASVNEAQAVLTKISEGRNLTSEDFNIFCEIGIGIVAMNANALQALTEKNPFAPDFCTPLSRALSLSQDIDMAWFSMDFEELELLPPSEVSLKDPVILSNDYAGSAGNELALYLLDMSKLIAPGIRFNFDPQELIKQINAARLQK